jgi:xylulokinase
LALAAPPGADGLALVPYFNGERTPNRPDATGHLAGIRGDVGRETLARAAFEGVVCGLLDGLDALTRVAPSAMTRTSIVLLGGGARSRAYQQIVADLAGLPVTVPDAEEQVALGAAVQAAAVLHDCAPDAVSNAWGLGHGAAVEPHDGIDRDAIRARYAAVASRA